MRKKVLRPPNKIRKMEVVDCACGCGRVLNKYDERNRIRLYRNECRGSWVKPWISNLTKDEKISFRLKGRHLSPATEFKKGRVPHNFKGDNVGYYGLHDWVERALGKARDGKCVECGSTENLEWSNMSLQYKRDVTDWRILCHRCHVAFDRMYGWGKAAIRFPELRRKANSQPQVPTQQIEGRVL